MMAFTAYHRYSGNGGNNGENYQWANNSNIPGEMSSVVENYRIKNPGLGRLPLILRMEGLLIF